MAINDDDPRPPYLQIAADLRASIVGGKLRPGQRLTASRDLADSYAVSPQTVHKALEVLKQEGLVESHPPRGVFVRSAEDRSDGGDSPSDRSHEYKAIASQIEGLRNTFREYAEDLDRRVAQLEAALGVGDWLPADASTPEPQPVVAAIVISDLGVLLASRRDGVPPWTFIAGEVEPGESITDAAVREVKEETGLQIRASNHEIARRVHPVTGRTMIYLACEPVGKLEPIVGDPDELSEVRWVSLQEAEHLLPGLYHPVHVHLSRQLGG